MTGEDDLHYEGWRVASASALGVFVSFASIFIYTFGIFLKPIAQEYHWSREAVSSAFGFAAIMVAVASPAIGYLLDRFEPRRIILPCLLVFGLVFRIALGLLGMSELSISVLTPAKVDTLCVGALLAVRIRRPGELARLVGRSGRAALLLLGAVLAALAFGALTQLALPVVHQIRNSLYGLFFGALTLVALKQPSNLVARVFQGPVLRFFGKYSYGLYVYHGIIHGWMVETRVEDRLDALLGNHALAMMVGAAIGTGVSLLAALASYHLLEKHFLGLKRYFEAHGEPSTAPRSRPRPTISTVR